ncbi:MAG: hypothetical protein ACI4IS_04505 [Acutalibacteraceae bacterium]
MKKQDKGKQINMFFSAFLLIAYVICAYFFSDFANAMAAPFNKLVSMLIFVVFGLLLFYATRVGDGKPVVRFSVINLVVLVVPSILVLIAAFAPGLPFHEEIVRNTAVSTLAAVALGYGIPYTFLSGFEMASDEDELTDAEPEVTESEEAEPEAEAEEKAEEIKEAQPEE